MDEEFVKKILEQAFAGQQQMMMDDANQLWDVYKRFIGETHPDMVALIEQDEYTMKKHFFAAIDIFTHIPKFIVGSGVNMFMAAKITQQLEYNCRKELHKMINEEKGKQ